VSRFGPGTMMALVFAILVGLGGAYVVREYLQRKPEEKVEPEKPAPPPRQVVFTATRDMKPGNRVTMADIGVNRFTAKEYKAFQEKNPGKILLGDNRFVLNRMLKVAVAKGEPFTTESFWPEGIGPGVEHELNPDSVAVPLPITYGTEILPFLSPGSVVDVLFRSKPPAPIQTLTLLRGVKVLAVGRLASEDQQPPTNGERRRGTRQEQPPTVTVEVSEYQSKWLAEVQGRGDLQVVLRNRKYLAAAKGPGGEGRLTLGQLVRLPIGTRSKGMSIYLGSKRQTMLFDRQTVFNDDLLIPTPIPRYQPEGAPPKSTDKDDAGKTSPKK
jgi:pilus assembly protein CpaB